MWLLSSVQIPASAGLQFLQPVARHLVWLGEQLQLRDHSKPVEILMMLAVQFGVMVVVSLVTRAQSRTELDSFFARLLTPVGEEQVAGPQHGALAHRPHREGLREAAQVRRLALPIAG